MNVPVPDPRAHQVEVENLEAATTNTNEANDVVMAEANVEPAPTKVSEANEANDATAPEACVVQPDVSVDATALVLPSRPHTIEQAYNHGQLITVKWPVLVPPPHVSGPQFDYHIKHTPQVHKPKPRLPRFPGTATSTGSFNANGFKSHNTFFDKAKNPTQGQEYHLIVSGAISSEDITPASCMIKGAFSLICASTLKPLLDCHA